MLKNNLRFSFILIFVLGLTACQGITLAADQLPWIGDVPVLFMDDFSQQTGGWSTHSDSSSFSGYEQGGFQLTTNIPNYQFWSVPGLNFQDVLIHVKATKLGGPDDNLFGVICRYQNPRNFYALMIGSDGYYGIFKMLKGEFVLIEKQAMDFSNRINPGEGLNQITAGCIEERLILIVNETRLVEVTDSSLAYGDVGLIAGNFETAGTNVLFDNFIVINP